jgi:hypothetical protein
MRVVRALSTSLLTLALLGPVGVSHAENPAATPATTAPRARLHSHVVIHPIHHQKKYGAHLRIAGQVRYTRHGSMYAAAGVKVTLSRRASGGVWRHVASDRTNHSVKPTFAFRLRALGNARYRVRFGGNAKLRASSQATRILVHRRVPSRVVRVSDTRLRFMGHVRPAYRHGRVVLQKRDCRGCSWRSVRSGTTGARSHFRFPVGAPQVGSWYYRALVPGSTRFAVSRSATFRTYQP